MNSCMDEYFPKSFEDFEKRFSSNQECREYIAQLRWPNGFRCTKCYTKEYWFTSKGLYCCKRCKKQHRVTAGTLFYRSHIPLKLWFRAIWHVAEETSGAKASKLKDILQVGSYQTAFNLLHKLRKVMVLPIETNLDGTVVIDKAYVGGAYTDNHDKGGKNKYLVAIAIEVKKKRPVRIRIHRLKEISVNSLRDFILDSVGFYSKICVESLSTDINLDELKENLTHIGYKPIVGESLLFSTNKMKTKLEDWLSSYYQGNLNKKYLDNYLNEFTFRFRKSNNSDPGRLFHKLIKNVVLSPQALRNR